MGVLEGIDPKKLEETGWGIIFSHDANPAVKEALSELIDLRREQAGEYFRIYEGPDGFRRPDESKAKFLARQGTGPGPADPNKVPYYLLIAGSPEEIPYRFQSQLDVQYAVGRIHFETLQEYANYASSVVAAESGQVKMARQGAFFGVSNPNDRATQLSSQQLVKPIFETVQNEEPDWTLSAYLNEQATKRQLSQLLGGEETPAFLFSASHGMTFSNGSKRQRPHQGALLCQDWPGPDSGPIRRDYYFAGDDLSEESNLLGLIAFFFASYGGGTPNRDEFAANMSKDRKTVVPSAFLAQLPTRMLGHPGGGALAVIGQIERAWGYSSLWPGTGSQTTVFEETLLRLMGGHPVGSAVEYFNERYAEISIVLSNELEEIEFGKRADPYQLAGLWTANNDARGYAIIGDPAVRLPVVEPGETPVARPVIEARPIDDDLTKISGIGPSYQDALNRAGISTITELANIADKKQLLQLLRDQGLSITEERIDVWIEQAADIVYRVPQTEAFFVDEPAETNISACITDRPWCLEIDALVLPVGAGGSFGGFANALLKRLNKSEREKLTKQIQESIGSDFGPLKPSLIPLEAPIAAQLLPNRPRGDDQQYYLIAATAEWVRDIDDLRKAVQAIVMKAHEAEAGRLCVIPVGSGSGIFAGKVEEVAAQTIHGIWAARFEMESPSLTEIIFAPMTVEALEAAREKERILTDNSPLEVWGDQPAAKDLLGIKNEAEALAETLILREVEPPISVAIIGGWGSGKSTVMRLMMKRMTKARTSSIHPGSAHVGHIYQIRFNAWTYAKSNLWASLMQNIFWELNRQLTAEQQFFELEKAKEKGGRSPMAEIPELQFLYDEYAWRTPRQWKVLPRKTRAALRPDAGKNELWKQLRDNQRVLIEELQEKEARVVRLKSQRERAMAERKEAILHELGQESQVVVYGVLRRRSRELLGTLYEDTDKEVSEQSELALADQLRTALTEITGKAEITLNEIPSGEMAEIRALLKELIELGSVESGDNSENNVADRISELRAKLAEAEILAERALHEAWGESYPASASLINPLTDIKQQSHLAGQLKGAQESAKELIANMRTVSTTVRKVWDVVKEHRDKSLTLAGIALVLLLVGIILITLTPPSWLDATTARLSGYIAAIMSAVTILGPPLKVAGNWSRQVSQVVDKYQEEAEAERQRYLAQVETLLAAARVDDEKKLQQRLKVATISGQEPAPESSQEPDDQINLAILDHNINQLELEIEELRREVGPPGEYESLLDFIQARLDEQFYEKRLGLMHQVRRDIDVLTSGLIIQPQDEDEVIDAKNKLFPRGPARVVLYIDDLDRCPPQRVVEVLEAVQLLLNTALFVVVLGLDTRYITRALEKEYKEILQPDGDPSGLDYIEKIVQLPYRVRPIGKKGIADFLKAQMQIVPDGEQQTPDGQRPSLSPTDEPLSDTKSDEDEEDTPKVPRPTPSSGDNQDGEDTLTEPDSKLAPGSQPDEDEEEQSEPTRELPPEVIYFQPEDLEDLTACCRLLKLTPRNVKRMVNVLKLINVFWFRTGGDLRERKVKRAVMGLLGLSAAYPEIMREVLDQIDIRYRSGEKMEETQVGDFLKISSLPSTERWLEQHKSLVERFQSDVNTLYQVDNMEGSLIAVTLSVLQEDTFNLVRSFSFVGDPVYLSDDDDGRAWADSAGLAKSLEALGVSQGLISDRSDAPQNDGPKTPEFY